MALGIWVLVSRHGGRRGHRPETPHVLFPSLFVALKQTLVPAAYLVPSVLIASCASSPLTAHVVAPGMPSFQTASGGLGGFREIEPRDATPTPTVAIEASAPNSTSLSSSIPSSIPSVQTASGSDDLLRLLVENGALTEEQARSLTTNQSAGTSSNGSDEESASFTLDRGGLRFESADGEYQIKIGGRIQVDGAVHTREGATNESLITDGTELRRGRFELRGKLAQDIAWWAEVDFANNGSGVRDFRFQKDFADNFLVSVGHQKQPYSLAVEESSNDLPFVERGVDNFLIIPFVDRALGVRAQGYSDHFYAAAGIYGEGISSTNAVDDEGFGVAGRLIHSPIISDDEVLHFGIRGAYRTIQDGANSIRLRDETTNFSNFSVVDTGILTDVDSVVAYGGELAYVNGPFSVGGEINRLEVEDPGTDLSFDSWHVFMAYSITGESRAKSYRLDQGEFKRLRADNPSGRTWEISARLASLDLTDQDVDGGAEQVTSLGVNWYWSHNLRFQFNWNRILDTRGGASNPEGIGETLAAEGTDVYTVRAQLTF